MISKPLLSIKICFSGQVRVLILALLLYPLALSGQKSQLFSYDASHLQSILAEPGDSVSRPVLPGCRDTHGLSGYTNPNLQFCLIGGPVGFYFSFVCSGLMIMTTGSSEGMALLAGGLAGILLPFSLIQIINRDIEKSGFTALGGAAGFAATIILIHSFGYRLRM